MKSVGLSENAVRTKEGFHGLVGHAFTLDPRRPASTDDLLDMPWLVPIYQRPRRAVLVFRLVSYGLFPRPIVEDCP